MDEGGGGQGMREIEGRRGERWERRRGGKRDTCRYERHIE